MPLISTPACEISWNAAINRTGRPAKSSVQLIFEERVANRIRPMVTIAQKAVSAKDAPWAETPRSPVR